MAWKEWAFEELKRAGLYDKDSDYGGEIGKCLEELINVFDKQSHSIFSARRVANLFYRLMNWRPLSPVTNNPEEWKKFIKRGDEIVYQNKHYISLFATESQLKNNQAEDIDYYYKVDEQGGIYRDKECKKIVNLPYMLPADSKPLKGGKENE